MNVVKALGLRRGLALELLGVVWPEAVEMVFEAMRARAERAPKPDEVAVKREEWERAVAELRLVHKKLFVDARPDAPLDQIHADIALSVALGEMAID